MALEQARYLAVKFPFSAAHTGGQHNPIYRHGPISIATLKGIAHNYSALKPAVKEVQSEPSGPPSDAWCDEQGLLTLSLDTSNQSVVGPAQGLTGSRYPTRSFFQLLDPSRPEI